MRLVLEGVATLEEVQTFYSLTDLMDLNLVLDARDEATEQEHDKIMRDAKKGRR